MGAGAALIQPLDRRAIVGPAGDGTQKEELFEGELTVEDVALGQAHRLLEIPRCNDLTVKNDVGQVRYVLR